MEENSNITSNTRKLPAFSILKEAVLLPTKHWRMLIKAGIPIAAIMLIPAFLSEHSDPASWSGWQLIMTVFAALIWVIVVVAGIVACHRIFLLPHNEVENSRFFPLSGYEPYYIGWGLLLGLCTALVNVPFSLILIPFIGTVAEDNAQHIQLIVLMLIAQLPVSYFTARWSLVLPAVAIGKRDLSLKWSWQLSSGNGWRLAALVCFLPMILNAIQSFMPDYDSFVYTCLTTLIWLIIGSVQVGLLSLSFAYLEAHQDAQDEHLIGQTG